MPPQAPRTSARLLAPIALVLAAIALVVVIGSSGSGGDDGGSGDKASTTDKTVAAPKSKPKTKAKSSTYTVKTGDTLGSIAEKSGVPVETLQELNPDLDPQALVSGQKIKLRE
jgi:LysM repeat protein